MRTSTRRIRKKGTRKRGGDPGAEVNSIVEKVKELTLAELHELLSLVTAELKKKIVQPKSTTYYMELS